MYLLDVLVGEVDAARVRFVFSEELHRDAVLVSEWRRNCGPVPFPSLVRVLQRSLSDLSADEADAIFHSLGSGRCPPALSGPEQEWFELLRAIGRRDAPGMENGARLVLSHPSDLSPGALRYAVAAGMLGAITRADLTGAGEIWAQHGGSIHSSDDLLLRVLVARSTARK